MAQDSSPGPVPHRLDKWLWAARFFKTRSAASSAINSGRVHLDGQRIKASHRIHPGVRLTISRGVVRWEVIVVGLNTQRRPAIEAQQLYEETPESIERRTAESAHQRQAEQRHNQRLGRPGKHQRRELTRIKQYPQED